MALTDPLSALIATLYAAGSAFAPTPEGVQSIGALWFLPAMFLALVLCRALLKFKYGLWATVSIGLVCLFTGRIFWLPFGIQSAGVASLMMSFGYWLRKREFMTKKINWPLFVVCACLFVVAGRYNLKLSFSSMHTLGNPLFALVVSASASCLVLMASRIIDEHAEPLKRFFMHYGVSSLVVLCIHMLFIGSGFSRILGLTGLTGNVHHLVNLVIQLAAIGALIPLVKRIPGISKVFY